MFEVKKNSALTVGAICGRR